LMSISDALCGGAEASTSEIVPVGIPTDRRRDWRRPCRSHSAIEASFGDPNRTPPGMRSRQTA
jgi:hypothetical protein